jgi:hypothetical protein
MLLISISANKRVTGAPIEGRHEHYVVLLENSYGAGHHGHVEVQLVRRIDALSHHAYILDQRCLFGGLQ